MKKVFIVRGDGSGEELLYSEFGFAVVDALHQCDIVLFTGGADVSPALYHHHQHPTSYTDNYRDREEVDIFHRARALGKKFAGICRGGQFLNVMHGGAMYQHIKEGHHRGVHKLGDLDTLDQGAGIYCTSTHHQMMIPGPEGKIVAHGTSEGNGVQAIRFDLPTQRFVTDHLKYSTEVVLYDGCVCFQPHPEYQIHNPQFAGMRKLFLDLLRNL